MKKKRTERESYLDNVMSDMKLNWMKWKLMQKFHGRPKHIYSIYRKMSHSKKTI